MVGFSSLPEGCISDILSFTSPKDVCRLAATSWAINMASDSDSVWERFLPSGYAEIIAKAVSPVLYPNKKQLFFGLSNSPILIGDGNMSFGLDKETGKKCYMLGARSLTIIWGDTPHYWSWISFPESRFDEVAQLNSVCWLEINGKINTQLLSSKTTYVVYLVYKLRERNSGLNSLQFRARVGEALEHDDDVYSIVYLKEISGQSDEPLFGRLPRNRLDGWKEIELGECVCDYDKNDEVEMRLVGMNGYSWKSGLIVQGIEVRPKVVI